MKKRIAIISLILVISVLAACLLVLNIGATSPEPEAKLSVLAEGGTETVSEGSLDDMLTALEGALSPEVATEYTLTLLKDATATKAAVLDGNGLETVTVELVGYKLSTAETDFITVGNLAAFNLNGGFATNTKRGTVAYSGTGSLLLTGETAPTVELSNLSLIAAPTVGSDALFDLVGGSFESEYVDITLGGAADATAIATSSAKVTLRLTEVRKAVASSTAPIVVGGAVLRLERGSITADKCVELNGDAYATVIDTAFVATTAVFTTEDTTATSIVNLGGVTVTAPAISDGALTKDNIVAWYGTGSTNIKGFNPADSISLGATSLSFAALGDGYTVKTSSTSATTLTTFPDRGTPTVSSGSYSTNLGLFYQAAPEVPTAYTMALLSDVPFSGKASTLTNGNPNSTVFIDFNGYNALRDTINGNIFMASGNHVLYMDGADAAGNIGEFKNVMANGAVMYNKEAGDDALYSVTNFNILYTNHSVTSSVTPIFQIVRGDAYFDGITVTYSGTDFAGPGSTTFDMIRAQTTSRVVVTNSAFKNTSTNGVAVRAFFANGTSNCLIANSVTVDTTYCASTSGSTATLCIADSTVKTSGKAYHGNANTARVYVTDTETTVATSELAGGYTYFLLGSGKNIVKTTAESITGGKFESDKYGFYLAEDGSGYIISYSSISLPPIYMNEMVLQARKNINIIGSCETEGATVEVRIGDIATATATVVNGKFTASFTDLPYAKDVTVTVTELGSTAQAVKLIGVDLGEIWVMSGQSNSVYDITNLEDFEEYRLNADNFDNIKAYIIPQSSSLLEQTENDGTWNQVDKAYLTELAGTSMTNRHSVGLSGIAYVMATRLATEIPEATIAIIDANFNGSTVEAWIDYDVAKEYAPDDAANYKLYYDFYIENGRYPNEGEITVPSGYSYTASGKLYQRMATACYNKMIAPLDGFSVAGTVWYQGEGNGGSVTSTTDGGYYNQFSGVRETFRNTFRDQNMPMFVIQIPPYFGALSDFKNLQYKMVDGDANSYIVANTLVGPVFSTEDLNTSSMSDSMVHYARKSPMGLSLAAEILENIYDGGKLGAPKVVSTKTSASYLTITFDRDITLAWGEEFVGFELGNAAGEYKEAIATVVDSKTLKLYAPGISVPKSVRYGYGKASFEFEDGTVIEQNKDLYTFTATETATSGVYDVTITDKATGEVIYTFSSDDSYIVRSRSKGNVIATTGHSLPHFRIDL